MPIRRRLVLLAVAAALALALITGIAFIPAVANRFGYALPLQNGLPCRLHYLGRDYTNDEQCVGYNRNPWMKWYDPRHKVPSGGICWSTAYLRRGHYLPLHQIGSINTLFGPSHSVLNTAVDVAVNSLTPTWILVQDGSCYRPYTLSGGP